MNFREKFVVQAVISLMIFSVSKTVGMFDIDAVRDFTSWTENQLGKHYTADEIKASASELLLKAGDVPDAVTAAVIEANSDMALSQPLGEVDADGMQVVYAPMGGNVVMTGISAEHGLYVTIRHDDKTYVYGNLSEVAVLTGERVRKGDIIGSFDGRGDADFVYELSDL